MSLGFRIVFQAAWLFSLTVLVPCLNPFGELLEASAETNLKTADVKKYTLVREGSSVAFNIASAMIPIKGTIEKYSGELIQRGNSLENIDVSFNCNLSSVRLTGAEIQGFSLESLLASVRDSSAQFQGRPVARTKDGALRVKGELKWRGKLYDVSFPVRVKEAGKEIILEGSVSGSGEELVEELPVLAIFRVESASANSILRFKRD